nr:DUF4163 domain-containing protein [uncultured Sphingomonas sp.]
MMKTRYALLIATLATAGAACSRVESQGSVGTDSVQPPPPAILSTGGPANAVVIDEENDLINFHYEWSKDAAAIPALDAALRKDMEEVKTDLLTSARKDKAARDAAKFEFHRYDSSTSYATAGQSPGLLSLEASHSEYTGGAHPNNMTSALLWDRHGNAEVKFAALFASPENRDRLLLQRWCDALNKEREDKRGTPVTGDGMFDDCPKLDDIAIIPADKDGNGRFERLRLIASPYVAGPYVEGSYEIELTVTPDLIASLKQEYRGDFESHQEPQ